MKIKITLIALLFYLPLFSQEVINLSESEKKIYSQNGEDGVIEKIMALLDIKQGFYVEFGAENGEECNTRNLRESVRWKGLLMDCAHENPQINLQKEFITAENICGLFQKYHVPDDFDLLSVDIDYNDFYVWKASSMRYAPKVVVIEYNATHLFDEDKMVKYDPTASWDWTNYYGASILSLFRLGRLQGYSLVYAENAGVNLFFIRDDLVKKLEEEGKTFKNINDVGKLYKYPCFGGRGPNGGHLVDFHHRPFTSAKEFLAL